MIRITYIILVAIGIEMLLSGCGEKTKNNSKPEENRFTKKILVEGQLNPMELEVAKDGKVFFILGDGAIKYFDQTTKKIKEVGRIKVKNDAEHGLIGFVLDPNFEKNGWIYMQYMVEDSMIEARVARITMVNDTLDYGSEKIYLRYNYGGNCCHTGGSMAMDSKGNLYIATADNTDAFSTYYSVSDDRPGLEKNDGLRSSANTNDYRGKILKIHPEKDGTFTIPEGNLFPKDSKNAKPEIFVMGCRNPFRISIDRATDILYWGEVGPDASVDSTWGPKGYDEFNRTDKAGNFGWPMFIGNNKAYSRIDFTNNSVIGINDAKKPINYSKNNTGIVELPPAQPAFIYYPYDESKEFPWTGVGGRTAIGGPVYHYDPKLNSTVKFPDYFDKKWIIADWMRNWIKSVEINDKDEPGEVYSIMPKTEFKKPIDLTFGPDGALYAIEFGSAWSNNKDTKIIKIEYNTGNRNPEAHIEAKSFFGSAPYTVTLSGLSSFDLDQEKLQYEWRDNENKVFSKEALVIYTFDKPGKYKIGLTVVDTKGARNEKEETFEIGNAKPELSIKLQNNTFYFDTTSYEIIVNDEEDGTLGKGIAQKDVKVSFAMLTSDKVLKEKDGENQVFFKGEVLVNESDCGACHLVSGKSIGPSFEQVAERYAKNASNIDKLANKVIQGGGGNWNARHQMSAHPQLTYGQAREMVNYILSIANERNISSELNTTGCLYSDSLVRSKDAPKYIISANYTDKGNANAAPLSAKQMISLRNTKIFPNEFDNIFDASISDNQFRGNHASWAMMKNIDFTSIKQLIINAKGGGTIDVKLDSITGKTIGSFALPEDMSLTISQTQIEKFKGFHDVYIVCNNLKSRLFNYQINWIKFSPVISDIPDLNQTPILQLSNKWKFINKDDLRYADPNLNTNNWKTLNIPSKWQDYGYQYAGIAWYRQQVVIPSTFKKYLESKSSIPLDLILTLGEIDDADEVYLNGKLIGKSGIFNPFKSAWGVPRLYTIPIRLVSWNQENTIAVRVLSPDLQFGGMYKGPYNISIKSE
ncbi:MAG: PQQ-dependent sugar dehydrogenase [Bacteroidota bacterium]|nr:PQQ-dependent sugar dehydrogenase [Bacteroidota bacterium]